MKKWWILLLSAVLLIGCNTGQGGDAEGTPTIPIVTQNTEGKVIAEAVIEPDRWIELRPESSGTVIEVLVKEGDTVKAGDALLSLDTTDAELAIQQAEAALAEAQAQLKLIQQGARPEQIAVAEAELEAAQAALSQAVGQRDQRTAGGLEAAIAEAQADVTAAEATRRQADEAHDNTMKCFDFSLPDGSEQTICPALGTFEEIARFQLEAAQAALLAAQAQLSSEQEQADSQVREANAGVWMASAQQDIAQASLDLTLAGSTQEQIAVTAAAVEQAKAALATAQAALEDSIIRAPFDGMVTNIEVDPGDTATQSDILVVVATLDRLQAKTKDLTELDIVNVQAGQPAIVTLDALPDQPLKGHVVRVEPQSVDYRGDVTYPVFIDLDEDMPQMRWGMTALVEIEAP